MLKGATSPFWSVLLSRLLFSICAVGLFGSLSAQAADVSWSGLYRFEAVKIKDSELNGDGSNKAYYLHHLVLTPKIIAADGLTIYSRFDLFNNATWGANNQFGEFLGRGIGAVDSAATPSESNILSNTGKAGDLAVTNLYVSWAQEFGQLVVGRAPIQFGLGIAYNAGNGPFDHYLDTRDMLAYKFVFGNFFVMPILAKVNEGQLAEEDDINDYLIHAEYSNPETDLTLGMMYGIRIGTAAGNDLPLTATTPIGGVSPTKSGGFKSTLISLFSSQKAGDFKVALEADLLSGKTGLRSSSTGGDVGLNSFAIASEVSWAPDQSKWRGLVKLGVASGDDPGTTESYEGFIFNRNYDVGMLMFNQPMGKYDVLRTGAVRSSPSNSSGKLSEAGNQPDTEAVSNVIYFAPSLQNKVRDNLQVGGTLVYGLLNKSPIPDTDISSNLGVELDFNVTYKPYERLTWVTEAGVLLPGDTWKGAGGDTYSAKYAYGLISKAAISF